MKGPRTLGLSEWAYLRLRDRHRGAGHGLALLLTAGLSLFATTAVQAVVLRGSVRGPSGPLGGAVLQVRLYDFSLTTLRTTRTLTTNASGAFQTSLDSGRIEVDVAPKAGVNLLPETIRNLEFLGETELRFELRPPVKLRGRVTAPADVLDEAIVDVFSLSRDRYETRLIDDPDGDFEVEVPADAYAIHARSTDGAFWFGRLNVDARTGSVSGITIPLLQQDEPLRPTEPPRGTLIQIAPAGPDGAAIIIGSPGSVDAFAAILVANLNTGQVGRTISANDGSFQVPLFAPAGAFVLVKHDVTGRYFPLGNGESRSGTIVRAPTPPGEFATGAVVDAAVREPEMRISTFLSQGVRDPGQWWFTGTIDSTGGLRYTGTLRITSKNIGASFDAAHLAITAQFMLERTADSLGRQRAMDYQFYSPVMTPTGLPIEMAWGPVYYGARQFQLGTPVVQPGLIEIPASLDVTLPPDLPSGWYRPLLQVQIEGIDASARHFDVAPSLQPGERSQSTGALPMLKVGDPAPPRLTPVLLLDDFSGGSRGAIAIEDQGKIQMASHVVMSPDDAVFPRLDPRTGVPMRYRLDPFLPMVAHSVLGLMAPPDIALRFPSGSLTIRIVDPDGLTTTLGPAPFVQSAHRSHVTRSGQEFSNAPRASDLYQLRTEGETFVRQFERSGRHRLMATGSVQDVDGNSWDIGGTWEIEVGSLLSIDTAVIPGTPFEVGDALSTSLRVQPPVPAVITMRMKRSGSETVVEGRANRFGEFHAPPLPAGSAGEYRVDVTARWTDPSREEWVGARTWGSVVATPSSAVVTHGRRGFDMVNAIQDQWFLVRTVRAGGDHVMFPFHHGDVMWLEKYDPAADIPKISVQDSGGSFSARVRAAFQRGGRAEAPDLEQRIVAGEIPLFSTCDACAPTFEPERIDQWGYFYGFAERPGVRVREMISEDVSPAGYWRFNDPYHFQRGNGVNGDLPNDFKFHFGGAVWRDGRDAFEWYGAYASLFVLLPFNDESGGRVMPPFQGNGGGPDGGPLFTLKGKDIDLFFHPTAVRPGTILHRGQRVSFAGYSAPTLPSKIEIVVTSPSGAVRTIRGQANAVGWFYDPAQDFGAFESGVWKAKVQILFDGRTSAGQVTEPFPAGDALGSRSGEFYFYVVDADAEQLAIGSVAGPGTSSMFNVECSRLNGEGEADVPLGVAHSPLNIEHSTLSQSLGVAGGQATLLRPADGPVTFSIEKPADLTDVNLTYTTTMPGFILEEGTKTALSYTYDAQKLAKIFPNLDLHDNDGFAGADTITISFLVSGKGSTGAMKHFARQIVIQGEELQMPDQSQRPKRRGVR